MADPAACSKRSRADNVLFFITRLKTVGSESSFWRTESFFFFTSNQLSVLLVPFLTRSPLLQENAAPFPAVSCFQRSGAGFAESDGLICLFPPAAGRWIFYSPSGVNDFFFSPPRVLKDIGHVFSCNRETMSSSGVNVEILKHWDGLSSSSSFFREPLAS